MSTINNGHYQRETLRLSGFKRRLSLSEGEVEKLREHFFPVEVAEHVPLSGIRFNVLWFLKVQCELLRWALKLRCLYRFEMLSADQSYRPLASEATRTAEWQGCIELGSSGENLDALSIVKARNRIARIAR
ncbi:hypothetical protein MUY21_15135 [Aliiroseovarius sp. S2029]|nr:hypothetical protein [Aliiroseovarius sp. S2029]